MKELLLLRHGKSDWSVPVSDRARPLNTRGHEEAVRVGAWLHGNNRVPELVLSSPAVRARQTAELVCKAMHLPLTAIVEFEALYLATREALYDDLLDLSASLRRVLVVGHNPGMEDLLRWLAGSGIDTGDCDKVLPTATVAGLSITGEWCDISPARARLDFWRRGRLL